MKRRCLDSVRICPFDAVPIEIDNRAVTYLASTPGWPGPMPTGSVAPEARGPATGGQHLPAEPSNRGRTAVASLILVMLALGGALAFAGSVSLPVRAATCDQGGGIISGTWTITTAQVCTGILYTVDGSINVNAGGSLTLVNGGLDFLKDTAHRGWALNVTGGGSLTLVNSIVTTQTTAIRPFLKLALTVGAGSSFAMTSGSTLKFPGWFNATGGTITLTDSSITGFTAANLSGVGVYTDDNDDSPVIAWSSTSATLFRSSISRIYENSSASGGNASGILEGNVSLRTGSAFYAYDSYIGVDYSNVLGLHNELQVDGTSNAYLYNVTIDRTQDPVLESNWQPAYRPLAAGGNIYLLRWLHATIVDSTGFPVVGATIWSTLSPAATTAQYPDNGMTTTPSAATLAYLGKTASGASGYNTTDANGVAVIPLYTDVVTTTSLPNANSFGNYHLAVSYSTYSASGGVSFNPYPAINSNDNNVWTTIAVSNLQIRTGPDLAVRQSDYSPITVIVNQPFTINGTIYNLGQTAASGFAFAAYLDGNRSAQLGRLDNLALTAGQTRNVTLSLTGIGTSGAHTVMLVVDPDNVVNEGAAKANNFANVTVTVQPTPSGFITIVSPSPNQGVNTGSTLGVTGYVRDVNVNGIVGVSLTIQLRSSSGAVVATNTTTSGGAGFFIGTINVPSDAPSGTYTIVVSSSASVIQQDSTTILVAKALPFYLQPVPLLGIQWWLLLIIIAAIAGIVIGVTVYFRVYGLGKMVECGECGAFIPEDATVCPKCGVEFEKDMARCSNCQSWIPIDVKQCPECGVEFATGEIEMADYQEKMRLQYDDIVGKFRQEAQRQLGRSLSEREFQEWWRKQPTFLTFEDWLREEEEMRKAGAKACPVCGTLNSVSARVCHKCGTLMQEAPRPPMSGGGGGMAPTARTAAAPSPQASDSAGQTKAPGMLRRIVHKPGTTPPGPIVQKKIVKRPTSDTGETSGEQAPADDTHKSDDDL